MHALLGNKPYALEFYAAQHIITLIFFYNGGEKHLYCNVKLLRVSTYHPSHSVAQRACRTLLNIQGALLLLA